MSSLLKIQQSLHDLFSRVTIPEGIGGLCHLPVCGWIVQQAVCRLDDAMSVRANQLQCAGLDPLRAFGYFAQNQYRNAEDRRFFLYAA